MYLFRRKNIFLFFFYNEIEQSDVKENRSKYSTSRNEKKTLARKKKKTRIIIIGKQKQRM